MYLRKKRNKSGSISVVVVDKSSGKYKEIKTIGIAKIEKEVSSLIEQGRRWISDYDERLYPKLDFDCRAVSTEYTNSGFPFKSLIFLSLSPFEPLLAVIIAILFIITLP